MAMTFEEAKAFLRYQLDLRPVATWGEIVAALGALPPAQRDQLIMAVGGTPPQPTPAPQPPGDLLARVPKGGPQPPVEPTPWIPPQPVEYPTPTERPASRPAPPSGNLQGRLPTATPAASYLQQGGYAGGLLQRLSGRPTINLARLRRLMGGF